MGDAPDQPPRRDGGRAALGASGERLAAHWLEARGYRIVARNWHCRYGELDLVALAPGPDGDLVAVEVKTRRGIALGLPEEAVTPAKARKLVAALQAYVQGLAEDDATLAQRDLRIDVLAVQLGPTGRLLDIRHHPGAVSDGEYGS